MSGVALEEDRMPEIEVRVVNSTGDNGVFSSVVDLDGSRATQKSNIASKSILRLLENQIGCFFASMREEEVGPLMIALDRFDG